MVAEVLQISGQLAQGMKLESPKNMGNVVERPSTDGSQSSSRGSLDAQPETPALGRHLDSDASQLSRQASEQSSIALPAVPDCPLCGQAMRDPVIVAESGHTYDRDCIEAWMLRSSTDPTTKQTLTSQVLVPNFVMRDIIRQGLKAGEKLVYPMASAPMERRTSSTVLPPRNPDVAAAAMEQQSEPEWQRRRQPSEDYDTLLELLSGEMPDLQEDALRILRQVLTETPAKATPLVEQGVVLGLVAVLDSGNSQAQSMAVDVLAQVLESGPQEAAGMFVDAGVLQGLTTMLLSPSPLCQTQSIGMLAQLASRYAPAVRLSEEGGLGPVVQLLAGDNMTCKEYAAITLAAVARHGEELVTLVARTAGAVQLLVPLLRSGNASCQASAAYVLGHIARLGPEYEAAICAFPLIDPLVQLLYFGQDDTKLYAAQLLVALCRNNLRNRGMVALAGGAPPLLRMLISTERAQQLAGGELLVYLEQVKESKKDVQSAYKALDKDMQKGIKRQVKELRLRLRL